MAQKIIVELIDDLDGKSEAQETVSFSLDGVAYEIDLSSKNAGKLRGVLRPWIESARKVGRSPRAKNATGARTAAGKAQTGAIREWAKSNGYNVSSRGRIQADIIAAYNKAS
ncbi:histone-like nucleoid-structuring protein Lsr2 [Nocardia spumae]|uniref:histone-like nucleoid-structuring protein Lsr2 n=1 Tax=Nocardia spumae TaxID=2887190 RepID=UPI001D13EAA3|nr:Lsr2 family protein [Nocardia spumae]